MWTGGQVSLRVVNVTRTDLVSLAFILHLFSHFCVASRLVCSFCEAMPGSLSVATTAVSLTSVAELFETSFYNTFAPYHRIVGDLFSNPRVQAG
jgi:hypothetical protein